MRITLKLGEKSFAANLDEVTDVSIPVQRKESPQAFYIPPPQYFPFKEGGFLGSVQGGGSCNCETVLFNPHGNGTHTEGVGHITEEVFPIYRALMEPIFPAHLISLEPEEIGGKKVVTQKQVDFLLPEIEVPGIIIRTLPNGKEKKSQLYSGTEPPFFLPETTAFLARKGIHHLITDLPSLDGESDSQLRAHRAFWQYPDITRWQATVTELAFIPSEVPDGLYLVNLLIAPFEMDASPSRPLLYPLIEQSLA